MGSPQNWSVSLEKMQCMLLFMDGVLCILFLRVQGENALRVVSLEKMLSFASLIKML